MMIIAIVLTGVAFIACGDDEEEQQQPAAKNLANYFTVQGAETMTGSIPGNSNGVSIGEVSINSHALAGGSSPLFIASDNDIEYLYLSVKGANKYYRITPSAKKSTTMDLIILFSQNLNETFTIEVSALLADGTTTVIYTTTINYIQAGTSALQVSLSFDNEKDVDLYLVKPDGEVVYYGNHDGDWVYDQTTGTYTYAWGLDVDSNPGCSIDGINNENIFYPSSEVQSGTYQVWINMYSNCDATIATNWVVTALHEGNLITPTYGVNPSAGTYPVGEPSNPIGSSLNGALKVMEFTMNGSQLGKSSVVSPLTQSAKMKLRNAGIEVK